VLKEYLEADNADSSSSNDFGKNVIPAMLAGKQKLFAYEYAGYWKDVGTVRSLWDANMELLSDKPPLNLYDAPWRIFSRNPNEPPHYVADSATISNSIITEGCRIYGTVEGSVLSPGVVVEKGAVVKDSIIMTGSFIAENSRVEMSIVDEEVVIGKRSRVGELPEKGAGKIAVIGKRAKINAGAVVHAGEQTDADATVSRTVKRGER
jgi:glucose-1-phosphate adenylyltransferase